MEERKKSMRKIAIGQARNDIKKEWVQEKINNYLDRYPEIVQKIEIEKQILSNDIVASFFAKDPNKQNISENLVSELLDAEKLPQSGKNSIHFDDNGNLCSTPKNASKAVDFLISREYERIKDECRII